MVNGVLVAFAIVERSLIVSQIVGRIASETEAEIDDLMPEPQRICGHFGQLQISSAK